MLAEDRTGNTVPAMATIDVAGHPHRRLPTLLAVLAPLLALVTACSGASYAVGDTGPGGGTVFYVADEPFACGPDLLARCRHLEAAPATSEVLRAWASEAYVSEGVPGADRSAVGTGWANTLDIIAQGNTDPETSAAAYADAYEHGGKTDWYLPSKDEIFELYEQRAVAGAAETNNYWVSTDFDGNSVWNQSFVQGPQHRRLKFDLVTVRPVRAF